MFAVVSAEQALSASSCLVCSGAGALCRLGTGEHVRCEFCPAGGPRAVGVRALLVGLGTSVRRRRKALGLTLAQLSRRAGVSLGHLSQVELGRSSASVDTLARIAAGLGVRLSTLVADAENS